MYTIMWVVWQQKCGIFSPDTDGVSNNSVQSWFWPPGGSTVTKGSIPQDYPHFSRGQCQALSAQATRVLLPNLAINFLTAHPPNPARFDDLLEWFTELRKALYWFIIKIVTQEWPNGRDAQGKVGMEHRASTPSLVALIYSPTQKLMKSKAFYGAFPRVFIGAPLSYLLSLNSGVAKRSYL